MCVVCVHVLLPAVGFAAIQVTVQYGPSFGQGYDLWLLTKNQRGASGSGPGSYRTRGAIICGNVDGSYGFQAAEVETFRVD